MDFEHVRKYWGSSRRARGLSTRKVADALTREMGYAVSQHQLANWEYKGTRPNEDLGRAIEWQINAWRASDREGALRAREEQEKYGGLCFCSECDAEVAGPAAGDDYCMLCGAYIPRKECKGCGFLELRMVAEYCVKCGKKFE